MAFTDGVFDVYTGQDGYEQMSEESFFELQNELLSESRLKNNIIAAPYKFQLVCEAYGYTVFDDDVTELIFGARLPKPGFFDKSIAMDIGVIDKTAQELERWCAEQGWAQEIITKVELVFEEKIMNLYDHGYDIRGRSGEQACVKLEKNRTHVILTVWDWGTQEPSLAMAVGDTELELELKNRDFSSRGRGRLMVRQMCASIERNQYGILNETIYRIAMDGEAKH